MTNNSELNHWKKIKETNGKFGLGIRLNVDDKKIDEIIETIENRDNSERINVDITLHGNLKKQYGIDGTVQPNYVYSTKRKMKTTAKIPRGRAIILPSKVEGRTIYYDIKEGDNGEKK